MSKDEKMLFIEMLIKKTKEKKLKWDYLDDNKNLCEKMGWHVNQNKYQPSYRDPMEIFSIKKSVPFNNINSFYFIDSDYYIVLLVKENLPANLYVIPNTYKRFAVITSVDCGDKITRLLNLILSLLPSAENFMIDFIKKNNEE